MLYFSFSQRSFAWRLTTLTLQRAGSRRLLCFFFTSREIYFHVDKNLPAPQQSAARVRIYHRLSLRLSAGNPDALAAAFSAAPSCLDDQIALLSRV